MSDSDAVPDWLPVGSEDAFVTEWLSVVRKSYHRSSGAVEHYFTVKREDFVLVVACRAGRIALVRQYRPGTDQSYWALPAGYIRFDESAEDAARRELFEETALVGVKFKVLAELHPLPGYVESKAYVVSCDTVEGIASAGEEIDDVQEFPLDQILRMVLSGAIQEMQAVAGILLAGEAARGIVRPTC